MSTCMQAKFSPVFFSLSPACHFSFSSLQVSAKFIWLAPVLIRRWPNATRLACSRDSLPHQFSVWKGKVEKAQELKNSRDMQS